MRTCDRDRVSRTASRHCRGAAGRDKNLESDADHKAAELPTGLQLRRQSTLLSYAMLLSCHERLSHPDVRNG
jgi:hypothetical protein